MAESQKMYLGDTLLNKTYLGSVGTREFYNADIGEGLVTDSSVLLLDSTDSNSYPGSGNTWTDLSGNGNDADVTSWGPYWNANGYWLLPGNQGNSVYGLVSHASSLNVFSGTYTLLFCGSIEYTAGGNQDFAGMFVKADSWVNSPGWGAAVNRNTADGRYELAPTWRINNTINQGTTLQAWTLGTPFVFHLEYNNGVRTIYDTDNNIVAQGTAATYDANNTNDLFLGRASSLATQYYGWAGKYVSAGIYTKVLTSNERLQNINYFKAQLGF